MQLVVPSAVRAAVMAATSTFNSTSQMFLLFIFDVFVKFVTFVNSLLFEDCAAFLPCHCTDETRPVLFREPLKASEACPEADVPDVTLCVVFAWRCPAADDVTDADSIVLVAVGAEQAEGGADAPFDELELDKPLVRLLGTLPSPFSTCNPPDVQRVAVSESSWLAHNCQLSIVNYSRAYSSP